MNFQEFYNNLFITEKNATTSEQRNLIQLGQEIAKKLNIKFNGVWKPTKYLTFTDKKFGGTFVATDERDATEKLREMQKKGQLA